MDANLDRKDWLGRGSSGFTSNEIQILTVSARIDERSGESQPANSVVTTHPWQKHWTWADEMLRFRLNLKEKIMGFERRRNHLIWIGPLIGVFGIVSYFMFFARFAALRDFPWVNLPLVILGAGAAGIAVRRAYGNAKIYRGKVLAPLSLALSLFLAGFFAVYIFSISYALPASETAQTLSEAPDFTLSSMTGQAVRLSDLRGRKVALVFYRGFW